MAVNQIADRIKETTTTTGTGTLTLDGAATGFRGFSTFADNDTCYYVIDGGSEWEVGLGTVGGSGTTLARTSVLSSSNAGSAVDFSAGTKTVFCDRPTAWAPPQLTLTGGTLTASAPAINVTQTWNNAAVKFEALKVSVTSTANTIKSTLLDLFDDANSRFSVRSSGVFGGVSDVDSNGGLRTNGDNVEAVRADGNAYAPFVCSTVTFNTAAFATAILTPEAAATLQMGSDVNGAPTHQTFKSHDGITGTDVAGAHFTLASGRGTGAGTISEVRIATPSVLGTGTTAQTNTTRVTIDESGLKATGYKSSDGTAGATAGPYTTITSITIKNGLVTALTGS